MDVRIAPTDAVATAKLPLLMRLRVTAPVMCQSMDAAPMVSLKPLARSLRAAKTFLNDPVVSGGFLLMSVLFRFDLFWRHYQITLILFLLSLLSCEMDLNKSSKCVMAFLTPFFNCLSCWICPFYYSQQRHVLCRRTMVRVVSSQSNGSTTASTTEVAIGSGTEAARATETVSNPWRSAGVCAWSRKGKVCRMLEYLWLISIHFVF